MMRLRFQMPIYREDACDDCGHRAWVWQWPVRRVRKPVPLTAAQERMRDATAAALHGAVIADGVISKMIDQARVDIVGRQMTIPRYGTFTLSKEFVGRTASEMYGEAVARADDEDILARFANLDTRIGKVPDGD